MDTRNERDETKPEQQPREQEKSRRFRLVRLEERIAPQYSGPRPGYTNATCPGGDT